MLRTLPNFSVNSHFNTKCAEIFCQSTTNFTIICTFCELKTFEFEDFLVHFRNVHFDDNLLKTEQVTVDCVPYLEINIKSEVKKKDDNGVEDSKSAIQVLEGNVADAVASSTTCDEDEECDEGVDDDEDDEYKPKKRRSYQEHKKFQCELCEKRYKTEGILKHHITKYHSGENQTAGRYQCSQCPEVLHNVRQLNAHMISEHLGFPCQHCDKKCRSNYELKRHEVTHTGVKNFVCDFENCGKRFYTRRRLTIHRHIHADEKNFVCETCGYSCRIKAMLNVHYRTHTGEKPYACDVCNKKFASSSMRKEHQAIHSTERPHVCDVCGATFSRPKALYHHKHLHLGMKKFKCKICGNAYAQAAGLAGHMRQHKQAMLS